MLQYGKIRNFVCQVEKTFMIKKLASLEEQLKRLKNSRSGYLSEVTAKKSEITTLLVEDVDVKLVKEKYESLKRLFDKYFYAHQIHKL